MLTPAPLPTLTSTPGPTLTPTPVLTLTLLPSNSPEPLEPSGHIYFWDNRFPPGYAAIDAGVGLTSLTYPESSSPQIPGPEQAVTVAFSHDGQQIAYLSSFDRLELWIADVNLRQAEAVWVDESQWLVESSPPEDIQILWGPDEKYVILVSSGSESHIVVYNLGTGTSEQWSGTCNHIAISPVSRQLALWCQIKDTQPDYGVLEWDGTIWLTSNPPENSVTRAIEWVFSPDGSRVLYATDQLAVSVVDSDGTRLDLPLTYATGLWEIENSLQWSQDGSQLLVYGYGQTTAVCPRFFNSEKNQYQERPCWHVFDSTTGKLTWWPGDELANVLNSSWDRINGTDYEATLSPDGQWLSTSLREDGIRYLIMTSIPESQTILIGNFEVFKLIWGN